LQDRAERERDRLKAPALLEEHYQAVLDATAQKELGSEKDTPAALASQLLRGNTLFRGKAGCADCHLGPAGTYSDGQFHNLGLDLASFTGDNFNKRPGRFAVAPFGEKNLYLIGAYRTPTLRSLLRTGPYFHNGQVDNLLAVVKWHLNPPVQQDVFNLSLDPRLSESPGVHRKFDLDEADLEALVLFLKALNGGEMDRALRPVSPVSP
jgi:cytochrome c peroxidase